MKSFKFEPKTYIRDTNSSNSHDEEEGAEYKVKRISKSKELKFTSWRVRQIDDLMFLLISALCWHFFVSQTVLLNFLKREFKNDNYDNSLVTVKGADAVQKQWLADVLQNRYQACNFIKKRLQHRCFPMKPTKFFKNTVFYRTPLLCWLLLIVNCISQ